MTLQRSGLDLDQSKTFSRHPRTPLPYIKGRSTRKTD